MPIHMFCQVCHGFKKNLTADEGNEIDGGSANYSADLTLNLRQRALFPYMEC